MNHPLPVGTRVRLNDGVTGEICAHMGRKENGVLVENEDSGFLGDEGYGYTEVLWTEVEEVIDGQI